MEEIIVRVDTVQAPIKTPTQVAAEAMEQKWNNVNALRESLTVITSSGHKFSANPDGIAAIIRKDASMLSTDTCTWYEDWGSFITTKVELQEALNLANIADQNILDTHLV